MKAKREADKTEVERLAGETAKETKRADELQAQLDTMKAERLLEKRDGALKDALTALNIKKDRAQAALYCSKLSSPRTHAMNSDVSLLMLHSFP